MSKSRDRKPKQSYSCGSCRKLKTRCNNEIPCSNCIKNNLVEACLAMPAKPLTHFKELIKANTGFGRIIKPSFNNSSSKRQSPQPPNNESPVQSSVSSSSPAAAAVPIIKASYTSNSSTNTPPKTTNNLSDFPNNLKVISNLNVDGIVTVPLKDFIAEQEKNLRLQQIINHFQAQALFNQQQQQRNINIPHHNFSFDSSPVDLKNYVLSSVLPPKEIVDFLKNYYFNSGIDEHHLIHTPTFNKQYDNFWSLLVSGNSQTKIDELWISLLFVIISTALVFVPTDLVMEKNSLEYFFQNEENAVSLHRKWFATSRQLLFPRTSHEEPSRLIHLQVNCASKCYLEATDQLKMIDFLLSESIMDCHYLKLDCIRFYSQLNPLERELRKRIWWSICVCDTERAIKLGKRPLIQSYLSNVPLPENCDDSELTSSSIVIEPWGTITDATNIIVRAKGYKAINRLHHLDNNFSLVDVFQTAFECDRDLFAVCDHIPTSWELPLMNDTKKDKLGLNNGIVTEMDRSIYRYRLFEKFLDPCIIPIPDFIPQLMCQDAVNSVFSNFYSVAFRSNINQPVDPLSYPRIYKIVNTLVFQMVSVLTNSYIIVTQSIKDQIQFVLEFLLQLLNKRAIYIEPSSLKNSLPLLLNLKSKVDKLQVVTEIPTVPSMDSYEQESERLKVGDLVNHLYARPTGIQNYRPYIPTDETLQVNLSFMKDLSKFISLKQLLQNEGYSSNDPELQQIFQQESERISYCHKHCLSFLSRNEAFLN